MLDEEHAQDEDEGNLVLPSTYELVRAEEERDEENDGEQREREEGFDGPAHGHRIVSEVRIVPEERSHVRWRFCRARESHAGEEGNGPERRDRAGPRERRGERRDAPMEDEQEGDDTNSNDRGERVCEDERAEKEGERRLRRLFPVEDSTERDEGPEHETQPEDAHEQTAENAANDADAEHEIHLCVEERMRAEQRPPACCCSEPRANERAETHDERHERTDDGDLEEEYERDESSEEEEDAADEEVEREPIEREDRVAAEPRRVVPEEATLAEESHHRLEDVEVGERIPPEEDGAREERPRDDEEERDGSEEEPRVSTEEYPDAAKKCRHLHRDGVGMGTRRTYVRHQSRGISGTVRTMTRQLPPV